jgi:hypothetical protein
MHKSLTLTDIRSTLTSGACEIYAYRLGLCQSFVFRYPVHQADLFFYAFLFRLVGWQL